MKPAPLEAASGIPTGVTACTYDELPNWDTVADQTLRSRVHPGLLSLQGVKHIVEPLRRAAVFCICNTGTPRLLLYYQEPPRSKVRNIQFESMNRGWKQ
ncbi:hypothetical protein K449DRAFT_439111 [Hypoxylon sp. EC38]|nr:hypothetical protein K449DRAFT_439111 [Hypoxylon sp. EC38]